MKQEELKMRLKNFKDFMCEEDGMGTVEIILIIVEKLFDKITTQTNSI